jgi:hypothetical protein
MKRNRLAALAVTTFASIALVVGCASTSPRPEPAAPVVAVASSAPDAPAWARAPGSSAAASPAPPLATTPPTEPAPRVSASASIGGSVFEHHEVKLDSKGVHKRSISAKGSCEGDCALGASTIAEVVLEQSPGALFACFPGATRARFALRLGIDAKGKVVRVLLARASGHAGADKCAMDIFKRATFPPGSDANATSTIEIEIETTGP